MGNDLWRSVDMLVDRNSNVDALSAHRLLLLAARRWAELGREIPPDVAAHQRAAELTAILAHAVLTKIRATVDEPLMVIKGPELAAHYPHEALRPYGDIDIVSPDPESTHRSLVAAGFEPIGKSDEYHEDMHHLRPLVAPGLPLPVEVHRKPSWVYWSNPPSAAELFDSAVSSRMGIDGLLAPSPAQHAMLVAVHSWAEVPLRAALDLVDVAALTQGVDRQALERQAHAWGIGGLWQTTIETTDALLGGGRYPRGVRVWARSLPALRGPTVFENHLRRWISSFWILPPSRALRVSGWMIARDILPAHGESWKPKLHRVRRALRNAFVPRNEHDQVLGDHAHRFPRRRKR